MKWLSFFSFLLFCIFCTHNSVHSAHAKGLVSLDFAESVDGKVTLVLATEKRLSCTSFYIGGKTPRIIFDFIGSSNKIANEVMLSTTGIVRRARFGVHENPLKTRMVLDLMAGSKRPQYTKEIQDGLIRIEVVPPPNVHLLQKKALKKVKITNFSRTNDEALSVEQTALPDEAPHPSNRSVITSETKSVTEDIQRPSPKVKNTQPVADVAHQADENTEHFVFESFVPPVVESGEIAEGEKIVIEKRAEQSPKQRNDDFIYLKEITHSRVDGNEDVVSFSLSRFAIPQITAVEGETITIVCDFVDVVLDKSMLGERTLEGNYVEKIIVSHDDQSVNTHIVLELKGQLSYDLEQTYYKNAHVFALAIKGYKE